MSRALASAATLALRFRPGILTIADDRGCVLTLELRHSAVMRKLRAF